MSDRITSCKRTLTKTDSKNTKWPKGAPKFTMSFVQLLIAHSSCWHTVEKQQKDLFSQNTKTKWYDNYDIKRKTFHFYFLGSSLCRALCYIEIINNYSLTNTEHVLSFYSFAPNERKNWKICCNRLCIVSFHVFFLVRFFFLSCQRRKKLKLSLAWAFVSFGRQTEQKKESEFLTFFNTMNMFFLVLILHF